MQGLCLMQEYCLSMINARILHCIAIIDHTLSKPVSLKLLLKSILCFNSSPIDQVSVSGTSIKMSIHVI